MSKEQDKVIQYKIHEEGKIGEVQIADEVVAIIAGLAATEVEGVSKMAGNITNELVSKLGMKNLSKGVKVAVTPESVSVDLALELEFGYSIPAVSATVQERVKSAIETMTGLTVDEVNIRIAGVSLENE
ncbi:MAG TPA: Asp23/Gls24 family envelope stress response protein [Lachnospiraceae bacterium]|nr:Asp23/Gls24 family envelope stress response protein [Clostridiales bacterium]HCO29574.1 Asp23/Gls24 family envelope stress response protein [Lachnospiraceae bacterium]HIS63491.1 Asp23/Gls24 family envelope stress response protein [Candidatus Scybalomonas excrementigallinarum]